MLVLACQVDVNSDLVDNLDVYFFETISKPGLIDPLLHWI